jgi:hypothetical protein
VVTHSATVDELASSAARDLAATAGLTAKKKNGSMMRMLWHAETVLN